MPYAGDLVEFYPGDTVVVEVVADSGGTVALRGDGVALDGETADYTQVALNGTAGGGVGIITRDPEDFTQQSDFAAGDSAGVSELALFKPVILGNPAADWDPGATGTQTPAVGDLAEFTTNGELQIYASADAASPYGVVFSTSPDQAAATKIAVAVYR